jgi:heterotetrameric sarcosine oxidase gamma subunit
MTQTSPLEGLVATGRFGRVLPDGPGTVLSLVHPCAVAVIIAGKGKARRVAAILKEAFRLDLPDMGASALGRGLSVHGIAPGQWLAMSADAGLEDLPERLSGKLAGAAMVTGQSHGRTVICLSGPRARDVLAKATPVDLNENGFGPGRCAVTQMGHVSVMMACTGPQDFELVTLRSFAESLWTGLAELALEWGYDVR